MVPFDAAEQKEVTWCKIWRVARIGRGRHPIVGYEFMDALYGIQSGIVRMYDYFSIGRSHLARALFGE
jgi:hypothetical protein